MLATELGCESHTFRSLVSLSVFQVKREPWNARVKMEPGTVATKQEKVAVSRGLGGVESKLLSSYTVQTCCQEPSAGCKRSGFCATNGVKKDSSWTTLAALLHGSRECWQQPEGQVCGQEKEPLTRPEGYSEDARAQGLQESSEQVQAVRNGLPEDGEGAKPGSVQAGVRGQVQRPSVAGPANGDGGRGCRSMKNAGGLVTTVCAARSWQRSSLPVWR